MPGEEFYSVERTTDAVRFALAGRWTIEGSAALEEAANRMQDDGKGASRVILDLSAVEALDTAGAWLLDRARVLLGERGVQAEFAHVDAGKAILIGEAKFRRFDDGTPRKSNLVTDLLVDVGESVVNAYNDLVNGIAFLGQVITAMGRGIVRPFRMRWTSITVHIESFAFRSVPIIALINFLVGCIVAQQGIFQLKQFGAATFAVDLIGILVCRELAVLLTSIMIAGRSGSAITAEIGSMKMREEIDAMRVMGLDPVEVLVLPRVLALVISLPLLTFVADISAIFGGLLVSWGYGGMSPEIFMSRLQSAIAMNTFLVGMIKAPFMGLLIGMVAAIEGFEVRGSAESLGRQVTSSVVKSIFMVIVVDGMFAMFFAAIDY
ncbi:MAG: MlaE family lipid ABC transporter permease subunit [Hyphomicrobiales bacterium]|nr:MlaE family lipid ABC transporter permease subunit [Hyphomicrobiales bacterium]